MADQWNMSFNYHPSKQAVQIYFSRKSVPIHAHCIMFSSCIVFNQEFHNHLSVVNDSKLTFEHHLRDKISKANKGIGLISMLRKFLPRDTPLTIYRAIVRPHLDYGDVIYDNPGNASFSQQLEFIQYSAALAIIGCIRETSRDKLYCEHGLETLADRRFCRRLCFFYKIVNDITPSYLLDYLPEQNTTSYGLITKPTIYVSILNVIVILSSLSAYLNGTKWVVT